MAFIPGTLIFECDKDIGPTFFDELDAYGGLVGAHFSWTINTIEFFEDTPQEVIDGVLAVYQAHDSTSIVTG